MARRPRTSDGGGLVKTAYLNPVADVLCEWTPTPLGSGVFHTIDDGIFTPDGETTRIRENIADQRAIFILAPVPDDFVAFRSFSLGFQYRGNVGADAPTDVATAIVALFVNDVEKSAVQLPTLMSSTYQYRTITADDWRVVKGDVLKVSLTSVIIPGVGGPSVNLQIRVTTLAGILNYDADPWVKQSNPIDRWSKN